MTTTQRIVSAALIFGVLFLVLAAGSGYLGPHTKAPPEAALVGVFEGQGTLTLGCSLWDVPMDVTEDWSDVETPPRFAYLFFGESDISTDGLALRALVKKNDGTLWRFSGSQCGYSIDWTRMPHPKPEGD